MAPRKSGISKAPADLPRPVDQNAAAVSQLGPTGRGGHKDVPRQGRVDQGPQASSLPSAMGIIQDVASGGNRDRARGVPGIITSTTLGPEVRQRLQKGIIESLMGGMGNGGEGPVMAAAGHDSTAYNAGMIHQAGSRFK
jgi:hypothetical protein